jgi:hypothetical protein
MNWRMVFDNNTPKLMNLLDLLRSRMEIQEPELLYHIEEEDFTLAAAFSPIFLTLYIYHIPIPVATRIFEMFMVEGETALLRILFKMLEHKRSKILSLHEHRLMNYLRSDIVMECIDELSLDKLIDL